MVCVFNQINPVDIVTFHFFKIQFNIMLCCMPPVVHRN
jgi:hypothetical protein